MQHCSGTMHARFSFTYYIFLITGKLCIDHLDVPARSIFSSPAIFKREAHDCVWCTVQLPARLMLFM